jgi:acetyl-CoA hydrolase
MSEAIDFAHLIREGDTIAWSGAAAEPNHLVGLLNAQLDRMPPCSALIGLGMTETLDAARVAGRMRIRALGGAGTSRRFQDVGLDVLPAHYSAIPDLVAQGVVKVDVVLAQLATDGGLYLLTPMIDYVADAIPRARVVIAEINDQAPCMQGDTSIGRGDIDHAIPVSYPLPELKPSAPGPVERTIGEHVARLIPDRATIQVGLGALPDAVLERLAAKKELGLHSGTIGDGVANLVEAGVITKRYKPLDTGLTVTAGLLGTRRLYQWAHKNPLLRLRSPRYTHDYLVLSQIPNLIGVNATLEIDLTGQMNTEVAGSRHIGLIGGHADFMRGCLRSPGGRGIVALQSTARSGTVSRIVPKLSSGIVTTSRSDADMVVTEYGVAELRGRTVSERAAALIAIAHPDYRNELAAQAERLV